VQKHENWCVHYSQYHTETFTTLASKLPTAKGHDY